MSIHSTSAEIKFTTSKVSDKGEDPVQLQESKTSQEPELQELKTGQETAGPNEENAARPNEGNYATTDDVAPTNVEMVTSQVEMVASPVQIVASPAEMVNAPVEIVATTEISHKSSEDIDQYDEVEEEYEEQYEEDGETKVAIKKRIVKVKKVLPQESKTTLIEEEVEEDYGEEEIDENGEKRIVTKKRIVKIPKRVSELKETKEETEEEEADRTEELDSTKKSQLIKEPAKSSGSFEQIDEEYKGDEIYQDEEELEKEKSEKSGTERSVEDYARAEEDVEEGEVKEIEGKEGTSEAEIKEKSEIGSKKEIEETDEKETKSEKERKSDTSLKSDEESLSEEKIAIAEQYEVLTKLRNEHIALKRRNMFLNNKLVQYFRKQKMDHVFAETKEDPALEQQYLKKLTLFYETNKQMTEDKARINTEWEAQRSINEELLMKVKQGWDELFAHKREIASKLIDPKTGRTVPCDKTIEDLLNRQEAQIKLISDCRLAQIKLKRHIEDKKMERQMQHAGKEFNLMDYEKLASLKEYYTDKITERDIEIEEVSQKMVALDSTLIQLKEQLKKKEEELKQEQDRLQKITLELNNKRANLTVLKTARHKTEKNTAKIKQQSGLLAYPILLKDYEEKSEQLQLLMSQIEELKRVHRAAVVRIRKLRESVKRRGHGRESLGESFSTPTTFNEKSLF